MEQPARMHASEPCRLISRDVQHVRRLCCIQALADLATWLPLPVVREHIQVPLLLGLCRRPDVVLALISVAGALGSTYTAAHIVPPLLAIISSRVPESAGNLIFIPSSCGPERCYCTLFQWCRSCSQQSTWQCYRDKAQDAVSMRQHDSCVVSQKSLGKLLLCRFW